LRIAGLEPHSIASRTYLAWRRPRGVLQLPESPVVHQPVDDAGSSTSGQGTGATDPGTTELAPRLSF